MTEPRNKLTARDLMTSDVVTVAVGSDLTGAMAIMDRLGFSQLPVLDANGKPTALLTETDARRALLGGRDSLPVEELASPLPPTVAPESRLSDVLQLLQRQETILVMGADSALAGIITYWDMLTLTRPPLMVKEVELILRRVVALTYERQFGPDWWGKVREDLRRQAEEEHRADGDKAATPEHMLGHTSLWSLIEIFRMVRPDLGDEAFEQLHRVRRLRNMVAHLYVLSAEEEQEIQTLCPAVGAWLISLLPPHTALGGVSSRN